MQATDAGLFEGLAQEFLGQAVDLDVHLQGVDALLGAGDLEVHVAEEVLDALDVAEDGVAVAVGVGDQPHGDAGHGSPQGHAGVHQGHGRAADAAHGRGSVGSQHFADHTHGVGEVLLGGHGGQDCPLGESAVADFTPSRGTHAPGLAHAVGREVVVVHELLGVLGAHGVQGLLHGQRGQRGDGEHLGLAAGEEAAAVGAGQFADAAGDRPDLVGLAAVGSHVLVDDAAAHFLFHEVLEGLGDVPAGVVVGQLRGDLRLDGVKAGVALALEGVALQHLRDAAVDQGVDLLLALFGRRVVEVHLGLVGAALGHQPVDQFDGLHVAFVGQPDALKDHLFGNLDGARLNHHDCVAIAGDHHVEFGGVAALVAGVDLVVAAVPGDAAGADGSFERDMAEGQGSGGADHAQRFRRMVLVHGQHGDDHLHLVVQPLGEQRADAAVGEAGGQYGLGAGASLAAEEAAGDLADGVQPLFKLDGQREEVDALAGLVGHHGGGQQDGLSAGDGHGAMGLLGQPTGFQGYGMPADLAVNGEGVHQFLGGVYSCHNSSSLYLFFHRCCYQPATCE